jgi:hypothetical protein
VRDAFIRAGHDATSCDIIPTDRPNWTYDPHTEIRTHHPERGHHYQGDVKDVLSQGWDLMIAHPPCTYLTNSGVCHLHKDPARWQLLDEGAAFFKMLMDAPIPKKCIENPIMHKYAKERIGGVKQTQVIQPWMFGHMEQKATCLWLTELPALEPTNNVKEAMKLLPKSQRERIHYLSPSADRWKLRSTTYQGIADAMAAQWG